MFESVDHFYRRQVFINCPFDKDYWPMFQAMVFTIHACGFTPRCALEASDAGEERLMKILRIIEDCHLGIHDLSCKGADKDEDMARFNIPFEMGLFQGAAHFGYMKKAMLVLEARPFDYRRFISDISGRDISHHENSVPKLISILLEWLNSLRLVEDMPGGQWIIRQYEHFQKHSARLLKAARLHPSEVEFPHFVNWAATTQKWLKTIQRAS